MRKPDSEGSTVVEFISHLHSLGVELVMDDGRISCTAPKGVLTPELRRALQARKPEMLHFLRQNGESSEASPTPSGCMHDLVAAQAARTPDAIAVVCGEERLTYSDLNVRSNRLANHLRGMGVGPETLVGICLDRSSAMVVALLAVLKAGGAYVPLDPQYPRERLDFMLEDSRAAVLITEEPLAGAASPGSAAVLCLDRNGAWREAGSAAPVSEVRPENLAYVIYTSGSTGRPKGVEITHRSVVNFLLSMQREPGISDRDRLLAVTTLCFDIAGLEIYLPLTVGAQVAIAPRAATGNGSALAGLLRDAGATMMQATPATWRLLLESGWKGIPGLKILCGGEAFPTELANRLLATGGEVWNLYGPTETTIWSTVCRIQPLSGPAPIGKAIRNTQLYVLDEKQQPAAPGEPGELYIGGAGVARGYLRRPELTAERFVPNPFQPGERIYRTGDLVRTLPDGNLEYIGRQDQQVKLRGFRIELGEIEAVLEQQPGVRQAAVLVREDEPGDQRLVAYYTCSAPVDASALQRALAVKLPAYMTPSSYVLLEAFPLTPNRKVDRKALPPPFSDASPAEAEGTDTEKSIAAIWRSILNAPRVGLHDNFFELGGHSLLIAQLQSRIRKAFSCEVELAELFERPTVSGMAGLVDRANGRAGQALPETPQPVAASAPPEPAPVERIRRDGELPLSSAQLRLWFLDQLAPESAAYIIPMAGRLRGRLNLPALKKTLFEIVRRHEVLRSVFPVTEDGSPTQQVLPPAPVLIHQIDLSDFPPAEREDRAGHIVAAEGRKPFRLSEGPLLRVTLLRLDDEEHILTVAVHHIVFDGWSIGVFWRNFCALYAAFCEGNPSPLPELPFQFVDFVAWRQRSLEDAGRASHLEYWKKELAGAPAILELPFGKPHANQRNARSALESLRLSPELAGGLRALAHQAGASSFMALLAAFNLLLYRLGGQDDILVGTPVAGRNGELEDMVGLFVNTIVVRTRLSDSLSFRDLLHAVRQKVLDGYAHQEFPFEELVQALAPHRERSRTPLFQVFFNQLGKTPAVQLPGLVAEPFPRLEFEAQFDITVYVWEQDDGIQLTLHYNADRFEEAPMRTLLEEYTRVLERVCREPERPIGATLPRSGAMERPETPAGEKPPAPAASGPAPGTETERKIIAIWQSLLRTPRVGLHDDFFDLGGHSLLIVKVQNRIREVFSRDVSVAELFDRRTVSAIAAFLDGREQDQPVRTLPAGSSTPAINPPLAAGLERIRRDGELPLSSAQLRLWFLDQLTPGSGAYVIPMAGRLRGALDVPAVEKTLAEIVRRHEILRATFPADEGRPVQVLSPPGPVPLETTDLTHLPPEPRLARAHEIAAVELSRPFDLAKGPLLRARLLRLDADDHVLLIAIHHIVFDGWSRQIFWQEFAALYRAFREGAASPLPELPVQYVDFAAWQKRELDGGVRQKHIAYWKEKLGGSPPTLDLPADGPRRPAPASHSAAQSLALGRALCENLAALSRTEEVSRSMTLLAALHTLLHRLSGQDDILVGMPIAGRNRVEFEQMIGFFVNTIVVRTRFGGQSFRNLLAQVRDTMLAGHAHQEMPFEELVEALDPQRDITRTPLFQVFFNHVNIQWTPAVIPGLELEPFGEFALESKFDLTLYVDEAGDSIHLTAVYNPDLFSAARIAGLLEQYEDLLRQICRDPGRVVDGYPLHSCALAAGAPDPAAELPAGRFGPAHGRFLEQAARAPDRVALETPGASWTYGALARLSGSVAGWLHRREVGPGDVVAVYAHRSPALVGALVGILRAGAAFCILDPAYPAARLLSYLESARPKAWLAIAAAGEPPEALEAAAAERFGSRRLTLTDAPESMPELAAFSDPGIAPDPDSPAYVAFTSGTTGEPKCILGTHRPLSHFLDWHIRQFGLDARDRFSMLSGLAHDPLLRDIFTPLSIGATLCIPAPAEILFPGRLLRWAEQKQITAMHLTPATAALLAESSGGAAGRPTLPALRYAFFGGDILTTEDAAGLAALAPRAQCVNFYGTTETPQAMCWNRIDRLERPHQAGGAPWPVPIGRPIEGVQTLILNGCGDLAGAGEVGEIHIRTPYLSRGYINDAALTGERFIPNPFTGNSEDRLYRTGDLGRYRPDGAIDFAGRRDGQVKIRGYRVETGAIEAALKQHPAVRACAVVTQPEQRSDGKQLVAYVALSENRRLIAEELRAHLQSLLPDYMIPAVFAALDALPLTPNGKIDRAALAARRENAAAPGHCVAPRNPIERVIAEIWRDVLGVPEVGVFDNFFELGGHSLAATRLIARLGAAFRIDLPLRSIFLAPTIAGLARYIQHDTSTDTYFYLDESPQWRCLVPGQSGGTRPPLFFVAGYQNPDDTLLVMSRIIPHMGNDQPVYGFRPRWVQEPEKGYATVEEAVEDFLAELRGVQPVGPYFLSGYCVGGVIALEMARRLLQAGQEIALLALADTERPTALRAFLANVRLAWHRGRHMVEVLSGILSNGSRVRALSELFRRKFGGGGARSDAAAKEMFYRSKVDYRRLIYKYRPKPYPGHITLFVNESQYRVDRYMGWKGMAQDGVTVHRVPGDHITFLTEHGKHFSRLLRECMDTVQQRCPEADYTGAQGS